VSLLRISILLLAASLLAACAGSPPATSSAPAICITASESVECAAAQESLALSQGPPGVTRHGGALELEFENGKSLRLEDSPPDSPPREFVIYHYHAYLAPQRAHVVHIQHYEGDGYVLISAANGDTRDLAGPPALSPDQARFLSYAVAGSDSDAELEIWRIAPGLPELELRVRPTSWDPSGAYWSGATRITVPPQRDAGEAEPWETRVRVELADGVWTIYSEARCAVSSGCS